MDPKPHPIAKFDPGFAHPIQRCKICAKAWLANSLAMGMCPKCKSGYTAYHACVLRLDESKIPLAEDLASMMPGWNYAHDEQVNYAMQPATY